jgi:hypothetical protein
VLLAYSVKQADHEHADRLSLLPIEFDGAAAGDPESDNHNPSDQAGRRPAATLPGSRP